MEKVSILILGNTTSTQNYSMGKYRGRSFQSYLMKFHFNLNNWIDFGNGQSFNPIYWRYHFNSIMFCFCERVEFRVSILILLSTTSTQLALGSSAFKGVVSITNFTEVPLQNMVNRVILRKISILFFNWKYH
jgi:hypothetical protein